MSATRRRAATTRLPQPRPPRDPPPVRQRLGAAPRPTAGVRGAAGGVGTMSGEYQPCSAECNGCPTCDPGLAAAQHYAEVQSKPYPPMGVQAGEAKKRQERLLRAIFEEQTEEDIL